MPSQLSEITLQKLYTFHTNVIVTACDKNRKELSHTFRTEGIKGIDKLIDFSKLRNYNGKPAYINKSTQDNPLLSLTIETFYQEFSSARYLTNCLSKDMNLGNLIKTFNSQDVGTSSYSEKEITDAKEAVDNLLKVLSLD